MNLNELAKAVAEQEAGKTEVNIAQIKEVIKVIGEILPEGIFKAIVSTVSK